MAFDGVMCARLSPDCAGTKLIVENSLSVEGLMITRWNCLLASNLASFAFQKNAKIVISAACLKFEVWLFFKRKALHGLLRFWTLLLTKSDASCILSPSSPAKSPKSTKPLQNIVSSCESVERQTNSSSFILNVLSFAFDEMQVDCGADLHVVHGSEQNLQTLSFNWLVWKLSVDMTAQQFWRLQHLQHILFQSGLGLCISSTAIHFKCKKSSEKKRMWLVWMLLLWANGIIEEKTATTSWWAESRPNITV